MNIKTAFTAYLVGLSLLGLSASCVQAIPITLSFHITDFTPAGPPISGTIGYDAATETAPIDSLSSVNLTIAGYTYGLGELGFGSSGTESQIYGNAVDNNFLLTFDHDSGTGIEFSYSTATSEHSSTEFASFDHHHQATTIPEPAPLALLGLGLVMLSTVYRKKS